MLIITSDTYIAIFQHLGLYNRFETFHTLYYIKLYGESTNESDTD